MLGVDIGASTYNVKNVELPGESYGFSMFTVDRSGGYFKFGYEFTLFGETRIDGVNYDDNYAYRMLFEYGLGVNISSLYLYGSLMADLLSIELDSTSESEYLSILDIGVGASLGAILHFDEFGISAYYTTKALSLLEDDGMYDGIFLGLYIGF